MGMIVADFVHHFSAAGNTAPLRGGQLKMANRITDQVASLELTISENVR
jgi:hypothetical protein